MQAVFCWKLDPTHLLSHETGWPPQRVLHPHMQQQLPLQTKLCRGNFGRRAGKTRREKVCVFGEKLHEVRRKRSFVASKPLVCVCVHGFVCPMCSRVRACVFLCMLISVCAHVSSYISVCLCVHVSSHLCIWVHMCVLAFVNIYVCVCDDLKWFACVF